MKLKILRHGIFSGISQTFLVTYFTLILFCLCGEVHGIDMFYEWSRRIFDFVAESKLARKFLSTTDPVTTTKLIQHQGYPAETHHVTTEDGYILEMHRIPYGIHPKHPYQSNDPRSRIPVILFHGNAQSSADWVINTPHDDALGFYLADSGYDVWMVNQRGNDYSIRHVSLTAANSTFWNYSAHEVGLYDIPAMIDYITTYTGHPKVHFIGFSLSNAAVLVTLAKKPEYNQKLGVGIFLAPGVFFQGFLYGFAKIASPLASLYEVFGKFLGGIPIIPPFIANLLHRILPVICHPKVDLVGICVIVFRVMFGNDHGLVAKEKMHLITSVAPSPFSVKLAIHGLQQIGSGGFHEYDYGISKNKEIYGRARYNLTNVRIPISIIVGPRDFLASPKDGLILGRQLPNLVDFYYVKSPHFRHLDFCYAKGVGKLVYSRVAQTLHAFSGPNFIGNG